MTTKHILPVIYAMATNLRLVLPDRIIAPGALAIACDRIAAIVEGAPTPADLGDTPIAAHDDHDLDKLAKMQRLGATLCEFPFTLEAAQAAKAQGLWVAIGAPNALRGGSHIGNLDVLSGVAAGMVDMLASDYYPAPCCTPPSPLRKKRSCPYPTPLSLSHTTRPKPLVWPTGVAWRSVNGRI